MDLTLDRHDLNERAIWQRTRFADQINDTIRVLERAIFDLRAALKRVPRAEEPGEFHADSPGHIAYEVTNTVVAALYNAGLQKLAHTAADLETTLQARSALMRLKAGQTAMVQRALDGQEDNRLAASQAKAQDERARRAAAARVQCEAAAQQGDHRVSIHGQCSRKGTGTRKIGDRHIRVCAQHAKHPRTEIYVPRERGLALDPKAT